MIKVGSIKAYPTVHSIWLIINLMNKRLILRSPISLIIVNLLMESVDTKALNNTSHKPIAYVPMRWWHYYNLDTRTLQTSELFKLHLNKLHPNIKFFTVRKLPYI